MKSLKKYSDLKLVCGIRPCVRERSEAKQDSECCREVKRHSYTREGGKGGTQQLETFFLNV